MDVLTAILACSLYADDALSRAIVESSSASNPFAVIDGGLTSMNDGPPPAPPHTMEEALSRVHEITDRGGMALVGLMQVPLAWAELFGRQPRDLFDPCINVSIGTARLADFARQCPAPQKAIPIPSRRATRRKALPSAAQNRPCLIRRYGEAIGLPEFVVVTSLELDHQRARPVVARIFEAPIFLSAEMNRLWGGDRVLFDAQSPPDASMRPRSSRSE